MTWKDLWLPIANVIMFFVLFGSAQFISDSNPEEAMRRRIHALCCLNLGFLLLAIAVLSHLEIIIPVGVIP